MTAPSRRTELVRILVTGGAGFIGNHLVQYLLRHCHCRITVIDNFTRASLASLPVDERLRVIQADVCDGQVMAQAVRGIDIVFHLAAVSSVGWAESGVEDTMQSNVCGTSEVLRAASLAGVRRLVFASSREVYGDVARLPVPEDAPLAPKNIYGASKVAAEALCRHLLPQTVILRLANVYGPGDRDRVIPIFLDKAARGEDIVLYGGNQVVDFVWIEDVVDAMIAAAFGPTVEGPINIGAGIGVTISELAELILRLSDTRCAIRRRPSRSMEVDQYVADISRACALLGMVRPTVPLAHLPRLMELKFAEDAATLRR